MFKNNILVIGFLLASGALFAQDTYDYDLLAKEACSCTSNKDFTTKSSSELEMILGICIIESLGNHSDDMPEINLSDQSALYKLGEQVGIKMATHCPEVLMAIAGETTIQEKEPDEMTTISGTIKGFEGADAQFILIEEETTNKREKLLWWRNFDGSVVLEGLGEKAIGVKVSLTYSLMECWSPKFGEYIIRKEITSLTVLE